VDFELLGRLAAIETVAAGRGIRDLARLRRLYGKGYWRKMKAPPESGCGTAGFDGRKSIGMKRTASVKKNSSASATSTRRKTAATQRRVAVCIRNDGYEASLERNKSYAVLADDSAERDGDLRVVDESGEDYLFAADRFVSIDVPAAVRASLLKQA